MESQNQTSEDGIQLAIGEMITDAASRPGAVAKVLCTASDFRDADEAVWDEVHWGFEVCWVVVGGPHVLWVNTSVLDRKGQATSNSCLP